MTLLHSPRIHDVALLKEDLYAVLSDTDTIGYVQVAGPVFVALSGSDLSHAVEVGQSRDFERAVRQVLVG
jgi:hypothetical protein